MDTSRAPTPGALPATAATTTTTTSSTPISSLPFYNSDTVSEFRETSHRRLRATVKVLNETWICGWIPVLNVIIIALEMAAVAQLTRKYNSYFDKRPVLTMMVTNSILNGIADTVAQTVTSVRKKAASTSPLSSDYPKDHKIGIEMEKLDQKIPHTGSEFVPTDNKNRDLPPPFDFSRLVRFASWGFIVAPFQFKWLQLLQRSFPLKVAGASATLQAAKRVFFDQAVFAPISLAAFFSYMTFAEGGSADAAKKRLSAAFVSTLKANYVLWPAVQMLNFRIIPIQFQLPFASTVGIAWGTFLSLQNSSTEA